MTGDRDGRHGFIRGRAEGSTRGKPRPVPTFPAVRFETGLRRSSGRASASNVASRSKRNITPFDAAKDACFGSSDQNASRASFLRVHFVFGGPTLLKGKRLFIVSSYPSLRPCGTLVVLRELTKYRSDRGENRQGDRRYRPNSFCDDRASRLACLLQTLVLKFGHGKDDVPLAPRDLDDKAHARTLQALGVSAIRAVGRLSIFAADGSQHARFSLLPTSFRGHHG